MHFYNLKTFPIHKDIKIRFTYENKEIKTAKYVLY